MIRLILSLLLAALVWAPTVPLHARVFAVAIDATTFQTFESLSAPTLSHVPAGTPTAVVIAVWRLSNDAAVTLNSVTYNGVSATALGSATTGNGSHRLFMYGLGNPASGTQTVQANFSAGTSGWLVAVTVTGSDTVTASAFSGFLAAQANAAASAVDTITVTSATGNLVINAAGANNFPVADLSMAEGADQTELSDNYQSSGPHEGMNIAVSWQAGSASAAMDYSWGTSTDIELWRHVAVSVNAPGGAAAFPAAIINNPIRGH